MASRKDSFITDHGSTRVSTRRARRRADDDDFRSADAPDGAGVKPDPGDPDPDPGGVGPGPTAWTGRELCSVTGAAPGAPPTRAIRAVSALL
jgi:hypothetical protein